MKPKNKRFLVDEATYNSFKQEPRIDHPDVVSTLKHKKEMSEVLNNPNVSDYDKVNHHATKLQRYLNNMKLALTRSKATAILGTPIMDPRSNSTSEEAMDEDDESNSEYYASDSETDTLLSSPASTFHTPMVTPSKSLRLLTPAATPFSTITPGFRSRRKTTKSPSIATPTSTNTPTTSKVSTISKRPKPRSPKSRQTKQKFDQANILKQFSKVEQPSVQLLMNQLQSTPNFHWNTLSGETFLNNKPIRNSNIVGILTDLTDPGGNNAFTPIATYKKLIKILPH